MEIKVNEIIETLKKYTDEHDCFWYLRDEFDYLIGKIEEYKSKNYNELESLPIKCFLGLVVRGKPGFHSSYVYFDGDNSFIRIEGFNNKEEYFSSLCSSFHNRAIKRESKNNDDHIFISPKDGRKCSNFRYSYEKFKYFIKNKSYGSGILLSSKFFKNEVSNDPRVLISSEKFDELADKVRNGEITEHDAFQEYLNFVASQRENTIK